MLTHVSLFTGIAGIDLAAEEAGFQTILFVEIDKYCQKVLNKHWPDVPIIGDIRDVTKETIANTKGGRFGQELNSITDKILPKEKTSQKPKGSSGNEYGNERTKPSIRPITLITGGFPCQPVSHAGKRRGKEDDRWLWPEMFRVISEIRSTWVVAENVTGLLHLGFNDCISDLESIGYETTSFLIPACGVNAPHRRDRIFIVAHCSKFRLKGIGGLATRERMGQNKTRPYTIKGSQDVADSEFRAEGTAHREGSDRGRSDGEQDNRDSLGDDAGNRSEAVPNTEREGLEGSDAEGDSCREGCYPEHGQGGWQADWWSVEPELGRVAHGIPHRVDRLKCLGNAVVPQQIYPILKGIADIENETLLPG